MANHEAKQARGLLPRLAPPAQARPQAAAPRRRRALRWLRWGAGGLGLILAGVMVYSAFLVYQFQHAIYHPLPAAEPARVAVLPPTSAPATPAPIGSPSPVGRATEPASGVPAGVPATPAPPALAPLAPAPPAAAPVGPTAPPPPPAPAGPTAPPPPPAPAGPTAPPAAAAGPGRINILVLGTDKRPELPAEGARSDTLIILSVDPQWKTAGILSVPRDLQVPIPGYGEQKINAAYFYGEYDHLPGGGAGLAMSTVSQYFSVPISYYVTINFSGFEKLIDSIGGITVAVPAAIDDPLYPGPDNSYMPVHFDAGCQHLDGVRALEYARTRHSDSDFGRNRRQQQVIQAVRARVMQLDMIPRYAALLSQLGDAIETNIPPDQQLQFVQLAGQIPSSDLYTAQIDNTLVSEIAGTSDLALDWGKAQPLLDWFFGRGPFADQKPGPGRPALFATPDPSAGAGLVSTGKCP